MLGEGVGDILLALAGLYFCAEGLTRFGEWLNRGVEQLFVRGDGGRAAEALDEDEVRRLREDGAL